MLLVLSYMEGASLHQERGGATVIARYGFNELWSFVAGWAILLDYLILIAITAFATTDYLRVVLGRARARRAASSILAIGGDRLRRVRQLARRSARGAGSARRSSVAADLVVQLLIVLLGLALLFEPDVLTDPSALAGTPSARGRPVRVHARHRRLLGPGRLVGARRRGRGLAQAGCGGCSPSACPPRSCPTSASGSSPRPRCRRPAAAGRRRRCWASSPSFDEAWLREPLRYLVAVSALAVLVIACNAAMFGLSRLGYSLARQPPDPVARRAPAPDATARRSC